MAVPKFDELFQSLMDALHVLGGSASIVEIDDKVSEILKLNDEDINEIHKGNTSVLSYRLAWARSYLKDYGLIENSTRGVWRLTHLGQDTNKVDKVVIKRVARQRGKTQVDIETITNEGIAPNNIESTWQDALIERILKITPKSFEQLCQRVLREAGFVQVEVTGRSGDGGIDGRGILKMNGLLSYHIIFQCKRYQNVVSSKEIRDFRGAMQGRTDKGIFITTSTFTRDAKQEATRDGAPPIDLIDGNSLAEKMKELGLGVDIKIEENISLNELFFEEYK